jgi:DNA-binding NarL/FixJ family response regulator
MRDRRQNSCELLEIGRPHLAGASMNAGSRELVPLVAPNGESSAGEAAAIVVIEKRALVRECLARCLKDVSGQTVVSFPSVDNWIEVRNDVSASLIVLSIAGKPNDPEPQREISRLSKPNSPPPTIVLSDAEEPDQIVDAISHGARGYIPTTVPLEVVVEVMRVVKAGGTFVPASSLIAARWRYYPAAESRPIHSFREVL